MAENISDNGNLFCENCRKTIATPSHLKRHQSIHTGERQHKCMYCEQSLVYQSLLKRHIRIHTGDRHYTCNYCDRSFTQIRCLSEHSRIHTGERPYTCNYCDRSFTQNSTLRKHIRIHTGERPYTCNYCDRSFTRNSTLRKHIRIHTGECPYTCNFCGRSFTHSESLKVHLGTHTREPPFSNYFNRIPNQSNNLNLDKEPHSGNTPYVHVESQIGLPGSGTLYAQQEAFRTTGHLNNKKIDLSPNFTAQPCNSSNGMMNVEKHSTRQTFLYDQALKIHHSGEIKNQKYVSVGESLFACTFCSYSITDECDMCLHGIIH